jgi:hypothetical protein
MAYATYLELRQRINKTSVTDDATLTAILDAATRNIDTAIGQYRPGHEFFSADAVASARIYAGSGLAFQWIDPCISITTVAVKDSFDDTTYTAWVGTDWIACSGSMQHPDFNDLPYSMVMVSPAGNYSIFTSGRVGGAQHWDPVFALTDASSMDRGGIGHAVPTVQITARWGYSAAVPPDIREACLMQAARWWKRFESSMSDTMASGEMGQLFYRQALDADIRRILVDGRYMKPAVGRRP